MSALPMVYIIILNWNGWEDTMACLRSLDYLDYPRFQVVVVDNGSTDDSVVRIRAAFPGAVILENGDNLGFGRGCNRGIRYAAEQCGDYVWLLNNDTKVEPNSLRALIEVAVSNSGIGAVGSVLHAHDVPEKIQAYGGGKIHMAMGFPRHFVVPVSEDCLDYLSAASLLLSLDILRQVGLFDEGFFMYWEDADLCYRIRRAGQRLAVAPESRVWHKESASLEGKSPILDRYFNRSAVRFFLKHAPIPWAPIFIGTSGRLLKRILRGDFDRAIAVARGFCQGWRQ